MFRFNLSPDHLLELSKKYQAIRDIPKKPVQQVAPKPVQQVVPKPVQQVVPKPVQQVVPKPVQQVAPKPVQHTKTMNNEAQNVISLVEKLKMSKEVVKFLEKHYQQ